MRGGKLGIVSIWILIASFACSRREREPAPEPIAGSESHCETARDCHVALACVDGECGPCSEDAQCRDGLQCSGGVCADVCESMEDCVLIMLSGSIAVGRPATSLFGCRLHLDERDPLNVCDGAGTPYAFDQGVCDPCLASSGGCADGQTCIAGECTCASNDDCPADTVCRDGTCGNCRGDSDCGCGEVCEAGTCHAACATDADCALGRCDPASQRCVRCLSDADCTGRTRCYADGCVLPCQIDECVLGECEPSGRCHACADLAPGPAPLEPPTACE